MGFSKREINTWECDAAECNEKMTLAGNFDATHAVSVGWDRVTVDYVTRWLCPNCLTDMKIFFGEISDPNSASSHS